jgi:DNA-directed RNA polymerase sigma subunit (sigma70/sigma32)
METTKEILNQEVFEKTFQKNFSYPKNAYCDIFGGECDLLTNAEETLEDALKTIVPQESQGEDLYWNTLSTQAVSEIFMLRYKENMTLREIANHYGNFNDNIEKDEENIQRIIAKTLRLLRHPIRSKNLKKKLEFKN